MIRLAVALTTAGLAAAGLAQPLVASPPDQDAGTEITTSAVTTSSRLADGNLFEERVATRTLTGTFSGPVTSEFTRITFKDGDRFSYGFETCSPCTVDGRTGTVVFRFQAQTTDKTVGTEAQLTVVDATGGLEGLHGILRIAAGAYVGTHHFDPS